MKECSGTLSDVQRITGEIGMVRYWLRRKERRSAFINGVGGCATGVVTLIVIETKFAEGAWAVIVAIPLFVLTFYGIRRQQDALRPRPEYTSQRSTGPLSQRL